MKIFRLKGLLFFILTISILCVVFLIASYGKNFEQKLTSNNPPFGKGGEGGFDNQNNPADAHKEFDVEAWLEKSKKTRVVDARVLNDGGIGRYNVKNSELYAQNSEPTVTISGCQEYTSSTSCGIKYEMYMTDNGITTKKETFKWNETPFLYWEINTNICESSPTNWKSPDNTNHSGPAIPELKKGWVSLSNWDSVKKVGNWGVGTSTSIIAECPNMPNYYNFITPSASFTVTPNITVFPTSYDFGNVDINKPSSPRTFTVSNIGNVDIVLDTITLSSTNADEFSIQDNNCSTNMTLTPSGSCTVDVVFKPTSKGTKSASLDITSKNNTAPTLNVSLTGSTPPVITSINSKYKGHVFYLDGTEHFVKHTANVDWAGHPPQSVRFISPSGIGDVDTDGNTASTTLNMGSGFGPCGELKAMAISSDESSSALKEADFTIMSSVPRVPGFKVKDFGDRFNYKASVDAGFKFDLFELETGYVPDDIPIFGEEENSKFSIKVEPSLTSEVTSYGEAKYKIAVNAENVAEFKIAKEIWDFGLGVDINGNFSDMTCKWKWGGYIKISGGKGFEKSFPLVLNTPLGKINFSCKAGIKGNANINIGLSDIDPIKLNGQAILIIVAYASGQVDLTRSIHVGLGINGQVTEQLQWPQTPTFIVNISLTGKVEIYVRSFHWASDILSWNWSSNQKGASINAMQALQEEQLVLELAERDYITKPDYGKFVSGRDYTFDRSINAQSLLSITSSISPIQINVFPYSESTLSSSGNNLYLIWLYDDPSRSSIINRTMAVFSSWNGVGWNNPQAIADDGTADFSPQILTLEDGTAIAAWENAKQVLPDNATFDELLRNLEIAASIYDPTTGQWSQQHLFTDNNYLDGSPLIAGKTKDNVLLVWIANETNDLLGNATNPNKLYYSKWDGTLWSNPQMIAEIPYGILKYDFAYDGQNGYVLMSIDTDSDLSTVNDHELYMLTYNNGAWGTLTRLTNDSIPDDNPKMAIDPNGNFVLTWLKGNELSSVLNFDMTNRSVILTDEYSLNLADFKLASSTDGKLAILYAKPSEYSSDIWAIFYDPIFGVWGSPKQLTSDAETEGFITAGFSGTDNLIAVYDRTLMGETESPTDLYMLNYTLVKDLAIVSDSLEMTPSNPAPGETVTLKTTVKNMGDMAVNNVTVAFYNGDPSSGGVEIGRTTITDILKPGDTKEVSINWTVPATTGNITIYTVVDPEQSYGENDRTNNVINKQFVKPDLTIQTYFWDRITNNLVSITPRIINQGSVASWATTVTFRKDSATGEILSSQTIGPLASGQSQDVNFVWDISTLPVGRYFVVMTVDEENAITEFDENNNTEDMMVEHLPYIRVSPSSYDFGNINVGNSTDQVFIITNAGTVNLEIGTVTSPSSPFNEISDACSGQTLAPDATCSITVRFTPTDGIAYTGSFTIPSNDIDNPNLSISLNGTGVCTTVWYKDIDNDGYSDGTTQIACSRPAGYKLSTELIAISGDCDDSNPKEHPDQIWYKDTDNDGYSDGTTLTQCLHPTGYKLPSELIATSGDCDDNDSSVNRGAIEIPHNGKDDDCNPATRDMDLRLKTYTITSGGDMGQSRGSESFRLYDSLGERLAGKTSSNNYSIESGYIYHFNTNKYSVDADGDGYGSDVDCNDNDASVHPGATEILNNGIDDDCNPATPVKTVSGAAYNYPGAPGFRASLSLGVNASSLGTSWLKYSYQRMLFSSTSITGMSAAGGTATVTGVGKVNNIAGCSFTATVIDGSPDKMGIVITPGGACTTSYSAPSQAISSGNYSVVGQ